MNAAQQNRQQFALLRSTGFEDGAPLTLASTEGGLPRGRELSLAWLTGTVMTGLTSVLLMGAALYVSFQGQATFSTAYEALQILSGGNPVVNGDVVTKTARARPVQQTRSEVETVVAAVQQDVGGKELIRKQEFERIRATLATVATSLSENVPAYDPMAALSAADAITGDKAATVSTDIYGAEVEGDVVMRQSPLPATLVPPVTISDQAAADFVKNTAEGADPDSVTSGESSPLAGTPPDDGALHDLGAAKAVTGTGAGAVVGVAENVTVMTMNRAADDPSLARTERFVTVRDETPLETELLKNGFTQEMINAIEVTLHNAFPSTTLPAGAGLRILFGPSRNSGTLIPYRMSIYIKDQHAATVALTDTGQYVLALAPPFVPFPKEDTEDINVANLPTVYRAIWETARKHDVPDIITKLIVGEYAYDVDETKKITPGDSIEMLMSPKDSKGDQELLYVDLVLGGSRHELYRFQTDNGHFDYFDSNGESGKRFIDRRPLQGGGRVSSPFGWRIHPIFHTRKLHTGVDLAAPEGTRVYAAADGVVERAGWSSGYGRFILLRHVNGYETAYGHLSRIAASTKVGATVRQGQVIAYVGHTGFATGPHLHFEIRINGHFVDPLSVKLPRDKTIPPQSQQQFAQTVNQIDDLMKRDGAPMVAAEPAPPAAPAPAPAAAIAPIPLAPPPYENG